MILSAPRLRNNREIWGFGSSLHCVGLFGCCPRCSRTLLQTPVRLIFVIPEMCGMCCGLDIHPRKRCLGLRSELVAGPCVQLLAQCLPTGVLVFTGDGIRKNRQGDRPKASEAGERLFLLRRGGSLLLLDVLYRPDGGKDVAGFSLLAAGDGYGWPCAFRADGLCGGRCEKLSGRLDGRNRPWGGCRRDR